MINVKNCSKIYDGKIKTIALNDISIEFQNKGLTVIYGTSGCGKTTLLNCLAGIDNFTSGETIGLNKLDTAFIFQDYALMENSSIYDNLAIINENKVEIEETLKNVKLNEPINKKINELSGGQKQRVAIARALLAKRSVIIADEPTGNLDTSNSKNIVEILKNISNDKLVIVVTHDIDLFKDYADRILKLEDGSIVSDEVITNYDKTIEQTKKIEKIHLSLKSAFKLYLSGGKLSKSRFITGIFILVLSFFSIMLMLNTVSVSEADMTISAIDEHLITTVGFKKYNKDVLPTKMTSEDFEKLDKIYPNYGILHDATYEYNIINKVYYTEDMYNVNHIIESNDLNCPVLAGSSAITDDSVFVSYYMAMNIAFRTGRDESEIIGQKIVLNGYELTVSGVGCESKRPPKRNDGDYYLNLALDLEYYCAINPATYKKILYNDLKSHLSFNTEYMLNNYIQNPIEVKNVITYKEVLNDNEILLYDKDYTRLCGDYTKEELLGKNFEFEFVYSDGSKKNISLKIVGFDNCSVVNEKTYKKLFEYSNEFYNLTNDNGICISSEDLNEGLIEKLAGFNIKSCMFLIENVNQTYSMVKFIGIIMIIIIIPIIIITFIYLLSYAKQNIIAKKREIGILKSLAFSNKQISKIFIIDSIILIIFSLLITIAITPIGVYILNTILLNEVAFFSPIKTNPLFSIVILLIMIIILGYSIFINFIKLNKKSDVDLIYNR